MIAETAVTENSLDEILIANNWKTAAELASMNNEEKKHLILENLGKLTNTASFLQSMTNPQLLFFSKFLKGTTLNRIYMEHFFSILGIDSTNNYHQKLFSSPSTSNKSHVDDDKQINMYFVNNVDIHA